MSNPPDNKRHIFDDPIEEPQPPHPPADKGNIFVVDDQLINLKTLTYMLDKHGYRVRPAINGELAIKSAQKSPPDLILLDIMMPDTEGFEVCRQLKADERTRDIPIIFISALSETHYKVKAFETGGVDYITKPFEVREVLARVETHMAIQTMQRQLREKNLQLELEIAERIHAEDDLRKLSRAVAQSASPIIITDAQGRIEFVNPAFTATTGYTLTEALNQNPRILKSDFHSVEFYKNLWETIRRGEVWEGELLNKHKNGMLYWEYATISPIKNNHGEITHFVAIKENITQRKLTEEATRQLNRQLAERNRDLYAMHKIGRALAASLDPEQIYQVLHREIAQSLLNVPLFTLASYNEAQHLITCKMSIVDGEPVSPSLFPPMTLGEGPLSETIRTGQPRIIDEDSLRQQLARAGRLPADPEERIPQSALYVPLISGDKVLGVFFAQDYTPNAFSQQTLTLLSTLANQIAVTLENARLFTQLSEERARLTQRVAEQTASLSAANAELSRAVRIKDEFLANMSHELRTPLNAILGMAEILKEGIYGPINPEQQNSVRIIEESGRHLLELINDILDLSKIEAGKLSLNLENVSVQDLCESSLRFIHQTAGKKQIKVSPAIDNSLIFLVADQRRFKTNSGQPAQ
jgi:PAS domain S-box-containing protein